MKKDLAVIGGLFVVIILLLIFGRGFTAFNFASGNQSSSTDSAHVASGGQILVNIRDLKLSTILVNNDADRKKGLSKRDSLPLNAAMLFVFDSNAQHAIWMKDMKFAIDILWLDESKKIIEIAQNVPPEPGKRDRDLKIYSPSGESRYVLETNAGITSLNNIQVGDTAEF